MIMTLPTVNGRFQERWQQARLLVFGDLMLDCYCWGDVRRISPEAPVPVVKVKEKTYQLGGAGNVAANLAGLGCRTTIIGLIGRDAAADRIRAMLEAMGIENDCLEDAGRPTITKTRIMASKQQVVRLDEEDGSAINGPTAGRLLTSAGQILPRVDAVILSDYGKGMFASDKFTQALIAACRKRSLPVFIDPKGMDWQRYTGASCITPNTAELELAAGTPIRTAEDLIPAAETLRARLDLEWLLVTRGPRGMALFGEAMEPVMIAARAREVFDVSGAGDTVIASLAACVAVGMNYGDAAVVANAAAGIVVAKLGTQPVRWAELEPVLMDSAENQSAFALWKVADTREAISRLAHWRQTGQRIVFTNGCFDLLHPGHVSLLHQARQLGDRLIVGLNTDDSIRRLKGDQRPILPGRDRAAILSALEDVDMVVFFGDDTPLELITHLKPDILVKGADYRIEAVVGKDVVESYGGKVRLVDILPGHSTTAIARKMTADTQSDTGGRDEHQPGTA
ncbi:MAG: bifunctional heptose 7-phosphate kinase/heptose 1-phosphate adenyltransferase [Proteobacteria bacterium]|nr:MAG: bifunctional heptose 7-phosphate kinase/heptose 1-phosphate adenyltransferase [Pseudomonadota bacterium]PIE67431.1 MAG: bifunctional heptose 7-phosphate kinase/heptose 1-phosphate adenyltransferase [Deltaproteobacteria bacterium]